MGDNTRRGSMHNDVPLTIRNYKLFKTLGLGAFGKVKMGEHRITGVKVAIKILSRRKIKASHMEEKVVREINILKMARHPHVIRLFEVIDTPTDVFMCMEIAPNGELFDYIVQTCPPDPEAAQRIFQQILSAVEYCHFHRVVHRDLKPENILLDENMNVKLVDFGLSNIMRDGEFLRTSCGSPNYAAPEVITGHLYAGPEADVWSSGVILYALLCGRLPFDDDSFPALVSKIKNGMYSLPAHLSHLTKDLIPRMLVVDPMKRITIPEIRQHPWFLQNLPTYLSLTPKELEDHSERLDDLVVEDMLRMPFPQISKQRLTEALVERKLGQKYEDLRVAYQLLLGNRHAQEQLQNSVSRMESRLHTPVAFTPMQGGTPYRHVNGTGPQSKEVLAAALRILNNEHNMEKPQPPLKTINGVQGVIPPGMTPLGAKRQSFVDIPAQRRKWYLGIQSKKSAAHVMTEVYRAIYKLGCDWQVLNSYGINCRWYPGRKSTPHEQSAMEWTKGGENDGLLDPNYQVVVCLTLYKVQQSIYLLDFRRKEGDQFSYMTLCAKVITSLKVLSAPSRPAPGNTQQGGGATAAR